MSPQFFCDFLLSNIIEKHIKLSSICGILTVKLSWHSGSCAYSNLFRKQWKQKTRIRGSTFWHNCDTVWTNYIYGLWINEISTFAATIPIQTCPLMIWKYDSRFFQWKTQAVESDSINRHNCKYFHQSKSWTCAVVIMSCH